ncbi:MAG: hypothetical protein DDT32_01856 [Syntrophomonadaceae bacterium]|nr:hypothetical protein [Bacillota bacterium]MBT9148086.1 hypothetical protein [Bacillota bacterium]
MKEYEQAREVIKETLGASWVDEQVQKRKRHIDSIIETLGKYSVFDSSKAYHPFADLWFDTSPFGIVRITGLGRLFATLGKCGGFEEKIQEFINKDFENTIYEFRIAYNFIRLGWQIIFCRTPDFIASQKGARCYVECKKKALSDQVQKTNSNIFRSISESIMRTWKEANDFVVLLVSCRSPVDSVDTRVLQQELLDFSKQPGERTQYSNNRFDIKIWKPNVKSTVLTVPRIDFPIHTKEDLNQIFLCSLTRALLGTPTDLDYCAFEGYLNFQKDEFLLKNPKFIGFISNEVRDRYKQVENSFQQARQQLPKSGPGLMYIELDQKVSPYQMRLISERLKGKLKTVNTRVNAVVLTKEIIELVNNEYMTWATQYEVGVNEHPRADIPKDLKIPGLSETKIEGPDEEQIVHNLIKRHGTRGLRPFNREGGTLMVCFMPKSPTRKDKTQYYVDIGDEPDRNRISLYSDNKFALVFKVYASDSKSYSVMVSPNTGDKAWTQDRWQKVTALWDPLDGLLELNLNNVVVQRTNVESFHLDDIITNMLLGTDISKTHFAHMQLASIALFDHPLTHDIETVWQDLIQQGLPAD